MNPPHLRRLCTKFCWIGPLVLEKKILKFVNVFSLLRNYLTLEKGAAIHLNPLQPRIIYAKLDGNWPYGSWEDLKNFVNFFSQFCYYLLLEKGTTPNLKKIESPLSKNDFWQVWFKLGQRFWRRRFLKFVNVFSQFCNYPPLEKAALCQFGWNWPSCSGEEYENVKSLRQRRQG